MGVKTYIVKRSQVILGTSAKTAVVGQHLTMMSAMLSQLVVSYAMNAKASRKIIFVKSSCVPNV